MLNTATNNNLQYMLDDIEVDNDQKNSDKILQELNQIQFKDHVDSDEMKLVQNLNNELSLDKNTIRFH